MIDWNVNEIKRRISRREIHRALFCHVLPRVRSEVIKIREGESHAVAAASRGRRKAVMALDEKSSVSRRRVPPCSTGPRDINHANWRGLTSNANLQQAAAEPVRFHGDWGEREICQPILPASKHDSRFVIAY